MSFISIYATIIIARHQSRGLSFTWRRRSSSLRRRSSCWRTTRLSGDGERDGYPDDKGADNARRFQLSARIFISCSNIHSLVVSFLCCRVSSLISLLQACGGGLAASLRLSHGLAGPKRSQCHGRTARATESKLTAPCQGRSRWRLVTEVSHGDRGRGRRGGGLVSSAALETRWSL